jgi:hypothetical protein
MTVGSLLEATRKVLEYVVTCRLLSIDGQLLSYMYVALVLKWFSSLDHQALMLSTLLHAWVSSISTAAGLKLLQK